MLYLRGLVNFALHFFYDAITDLETVIEKSEEASAKHYLARGRGYACLSMFKEAITDLSIAINLNKDLLDVSDTILITLKSNHTFPLFRPISTAVNAPTSSATPASPSWTSKNSSLSSL